MSLQGRSTGVSSVWLWERIFCTFHQLQTSNIAQPAFSNPWNQYVTPQLGVQPHIHTYIHTYIHVDHYYAKWNYAQNSVCVCVRTYIHVCVQLCTHLNPIISLKSVQLKSVNLYPSLEKANTAFGPSQTAPSMRGVKWTPRNGNRGSGT